MARRVRRIGRVVVALGLAAGLGAVAMLGGGCYQRTVRASGPGAQGISTQEGNLRTGKERTPLDYVGDVIFGPVE